MQNHLVKILRSSHEKKRYAVGFSRAGSGCALQVQMRKWLVTMGGKRLAADSSPVAVSPANCQPWLMRG